MAEEHPETPSREATQRTWADAAAALAAGDLPGFAAQARAAAVAMAASGDAAAARGLVALRAQLLARAPVTTAPAEALASVIAELATCPAEDADLLWPFALALVAELPERHPLRAAEADLGWDGLASVVVLAALAAGEVADVALLAELAAAGRDVVAASVADLVAQGALVERGAGLVAPAPILAAGCACRPSPYALPPAPSRFSRETFAAATFDRDGVFVAEVASATTAIATLRAAQVPAIVVPREARVDGYRLAWFARDADWRGVPLLLELDAAPTADQLAILTVIPRAIVIPVAPATADELGAALAAQRSDVVAWRPLELAPAEAADLVGGALGVPADQLRLGRLHAAEVDELVDTITALGVRGEAAGWALAAELGRRAVDELAPYVFGAAPEVPAAVVDRARELLAADAGWSGRTSALVAPLSVAASVALALARDRHVVAATLALGADDAEARLEQATAAARRWGAVLCVGIDRARPAVMTAFARRLAAGGVVAVIAVRPGTPIPPVLAPLVSTLAV